ncbi:hypothetical protein TNCV_2820851 [Trichonephila clavipes]|nr:hypothetical protein TNCV_2820851 [Trichonephila clavipes]
MPREGDLIKFDRWQVDLHFIRARAWSEGVKNIVVEITPNDNKFAIWKSHLSKLGWDKERFHLTTTNGVVSFVLVQRPSSNGEAYPSHFFPSKCHSTNTGYEGRCREVNKDSGGKKKGCQ